MWCLFNSYKNYMENMVDQTVTMMNYWRVLSKLFN